MAIKRTAADQLVSALFRFPHYNTQADYTRVTGRVCPAFNPAKRIKRWEDPAAATQRKDKVLQYLALAVDCETGVPLAMNGDRDGQPYVEPFGMLAGEAATVNIPPDGATQENFVEGVGAQYPDPLKTLSATQALYFEAIPGAKNVLVRDLVEYGRLAPQIAEDAGKFTADDRALLLAIADKLGVTL